MIDPDLHPLPITPNDPLSIFSNNKMKFGSMDPRKQELKFLTPTTAEVTSSAIEEMYDMEILNSEINPDSLFESALPSLKINLTEESQAKRRQLNPKNLELEVKKERLRKAINMADETGVERALDFAQHDIMKKINHANVENIKLEQRLS